ncbi:ATP-binding protein [Aneurinibacillus thermoaerophilus]|uniref:HAMP domain-containing sensor histidine kinase n=1 Tax=Aneurinibacillus thermoaerophilus TaxID=143495 RepID=UPI002E1F9309|nr:ATP-binding protein [Aneurinibacillus thermoaerophilus]MED0765000.1 ATP-binding protein [Aneurinibacillus thermoaerophilus]
MLNRVVVKLWFTIIGLVAVVLTVLSLTLMSFLDGFYEKQRTEDLKQLAQNIAHVILVYKDREKTLSIARELVDVYDTRMVITGSLGKYINQDVDRRDKTIPEVKAEEFLKHPVLRQARNDRIAVTRDFFQVVPDKGRVPRYEEFVAVAVPLHSPDLNNELILYQTMDELRETTNKTTWLIFYAAVIGIILTTFFAFFLSTRITQPLHSMKKAADLYAQGDFSAQISIRTNDEIGDLASTFNHMASRLNDLIVALSREKEQLSSVLKSMVDAVMTFDHHGRIIVTNPPAEALLKAWEYEQGMEEDNDVEKGIKFLPDSMRSILEQAVRNAEEVVTDVVVQGRIYAVVMAPLYDDDQIRGAVAVLRDMTQERRLDKLRQDFVANVSHELRTPLMMLQGYSEAIIDDIAQTAEEKKELAQIIYDESLRMSRLVNELLDIARMEAGYTQLDIRPGNLLQLEDKVIRKFNGVAKEQGICLQMDWQAPDSMFYFDADRLEQVLTNLIDNAIRHTGQGGRVTLRTFMQDEMYIIEVADTGSGIPADDLPFVFERFYKADKARTRGRAGTGLGLSIVKNIVEGHHGTIAVRSKLGEGTTFSIQLPIQPEEGRNR